MISLDQIKALEAKVHSAVDEITRLRRENETLTDAVTNSEQRLRELEGLVGEFKNEQAEIEATIVRTLQNLDRLEDGLSPTESERSNQDPGGELEAAHEAAARKQAAVPGEGEGGDDQELEIF